MASLAERLAARTLELIDIPSESLHEAAVRDRLLELIPEPYAPEYAGDEVYLFACERRPELPLVVLAGHYDTVPAQENIPGSMVDGAVRGLGAADMKGGVAVALELVRDLAEQPSPHTDVALLLFGREELPPEFSPLPDLFARSRLVGEAALAILLEPTAGAIQAGCVGNLNARVTFRGVSGHSARPWLAENAVHKALVALTPVAALERREVVISGLPFYEVVSVTTIEAGIAANVVPDRATATLNFRYTPDRTSEDAEAYLRSLVPTADEIELSGASPPARVVADAPLVTALRDAGRLDVQPKQAWTNVADFTTRGIDAVNFGPGDPRFAHRRDEQVEIAELVRCFETLRRFVGG
jgi:succinyl-diaminopimelate desuccinylase